MGGPCKGCKVRDYPTCQTSGSCAAWMAYQERKKTVDAEKRKSKTFFDGYYRVLNKKQPRGSKYSNAKVKRGNRQS